jgi:enamine deaminase RidA (YjgF/YER057c/UK114 family)
MAKIERLAAKSVWDPPTYSQVIRVSGAQAVVFVAGQVSYDKKGGVAHPGDFKAQAREVFRSVVAQVKAAGGKPENVVKLNSYRADFGAIRGEVFGDTLPASTLVQVAALAHPDYMIEVEAIAVI